MKILRLSFFSFLFSLIALIVSDQILFIYWYIPQVKQLTHIPFYYNYEVLLPVAIVIIFFGFVVSPWKKLCIVALMFAISHQIIDFASISFGYAGFLQNFAVTDHFYFWTVRPGLMFCLYLLALSAVWLIKVGVRKSYARITGDSENSSLTDNQKALKTAGAKDSLSGTHMHTRITYHVVPDPSGWLVKKGRAKKASSAHTTKEEAMHAASDLAKNHPLSQVIVHKASGIIASDRTYEYRHYEQKRRKKEVIKKIKRGMKRSKRKEEEQRLRRRKAAQLGIARLKRKRYLRRQAAKKAAKKRKK
jgi:hypothetical protein